MEEVLVPIAVCVALPVLIVWLVNRTRQNETNRKTEIMLKAIESGAAIDVDFFKAKQEGMTIKERLLKRLTTGCVCTLLGIALLIIGAVNGRMCLEMITSNDSSSVPMIFGGAFLAVGIAFLVVFFVGKRMMAKEIEAEEKSLENK